MYGMYLSATGVITSAYRQDLIANNLANAETTGFKRDLATFYQRQTAVQENPLLAGISNPILQKIGGGTYASPTMLDTTTGVLESTGSALDVAVDGSGYFTVAGADGQPRLTRDGRFRTNESGQLAMAAGKGNLVLNAQGQPIRLNPALPVNIDTSGNVIQGTDILGRLAVVEVPDPAGLKKEGGSLLSYSDYSTLTPSQSQLRSGFLERSNVDPALELSALMDTQRQLEANANMIKYQDQTLGELVNTVGKVS